MDVTKDDVLAARLAAGLTQPQAAALIGKTRWQTWQEWELGVSAPDAASYRLFLHLAGLERLPFGTIRHKGKSAQAEAAELQGKIEEMMAGTAHPSRRQR